jgi:transcriptional regulator with XRE-family HTH domain
MAHTVDVRKRETVGRRLAAARALRGLSQSEAAKAIGHTQTHISKLENDRCERASIVTIAKLASIYGVSIDYLVNGTQAVA